MAQELVTVIDRREHTAVALTKEGEEITLYRGNLQRHQRTATWDWETITLGTQCRVTVIEAEKARYRRRGIEIAIIDP